MSTPRPWLLALLALPIQLGCSKEPAPPPKPPRSATPAPALPFSNVTPASDPSFVYHHGGAGNYYFPEIMGGGVALVDYDFDGDLDLFLPQGAKIGPGDDEADWPSVPEDLRDRLFRLDGSSGLDYHDVTGGTGILGKRYGLGTAVGDADGDGTPDLFVANWGPDQLWSNRGDGTFEAADGPHDGGWSSGATFFDYDRDGDLDLYVARYVKYPTPVKHQCRTVDGRPDYCGPLRYPPETDLLYRNRGDGTFEEVSSQAEIDRSSGRSLGVVAADFDGDGHTDLFVTSDGSENLLWFNRGDGTFENRATQSGCALNMLGEPEASMGIAVADVDGDGHLDLLATHLFAETNTLYLNDGLGLFRDASLATGLGSPSLDYTSFGVAWLDANHDGRLDLTSTSGRVRIPPERTRDPEPYPFDQPGQFFLGRPDGSFEEIEGPWSERGVGRGLAVGDLDGDGDLDVVVVNAGGLLRILQNDHAQAADWIALRIQGGVGRFLGSRVTLLQDGAPARHAWIHRDGSYGSSSEPVAHFGLGESRGPLTLELRPRDLPPVRLRGLAPGVSYRWVPRS